MTDAKSLPALTPIGENPTLLWGMTNAERLRRMAKVPRRLRVPASEHANARRPRAELGSRKLRISLILRISPSC